MPLIVLTTENNRNKKNGFHYILFILANECA